jgi:hypothetical protein
VNGQADTAGAAAVFDPATSVLQTCRYLPCGSLMAHSDCLVWLPSGTCGGNERRGLGLLQTSGLSLCFPVQPQR